MANYYTHFSCLLDVGTPENAAHALDLYNALSEENAAAVELVSGTAQRLVGLSDALKSSVSRFQL